VERSSKLFSWGAGRRAAQTRSATRSSRAPDTAAILPPDVNDFGHRPFSERELRALAGWLADASWPRGTLSIAGLEGYLVALILLPLAAHPGTWLPAIWNDSGWRLAPPVSQPERFREFVELTCGFMRHLRACLATDPAALRSVCEMTPPPLALPASQGCRDWAQGFGRAIRHTSRLHIPSVAPEYQALVTIAVCAGTRPAAPAPAVSFNRLHQAIIVLAQSLAAGRTTDSPLRGPVASRTPDRRQIVRDESPPVPGEDSQVPATADRRRHQAAID